MYIYDEYFNSIGSFYVDSAASRSFFATRGTTGMYYICIQSLSGQYLSDNYNITVEPNYPPAYYLDSFEIPKKVYKAGDVIESDQLLFAGGGYGEIVLNIEPRNFTSDQPVAFELEYHGNPNDIWFNWDFAYLGEGDFYRQFSEPYKSWSMSYPVGYRKNPDKYLKLTVNVISDCEVSGTITTWFRDYEQWE